LRYKDPNEVPIQRNLDVHFWDGREPVEVRIYGRRNTDGPVDDVELEALLQWTGPYKEFRLRWADVQDMEDSSRVSADY
jgi:hypothetical protein